MLRKETLWEVVSSSKTLIGALCVNGFLFSVKWRWWKDGALVESALIQQNLSWLDKSDGHFDEGEWKLRAFYMNKKGS